MKKISKGPLFIFRKVSVKEISLLLGIILVIVFSILNFGVIGPDGHWAIQNLLTGDGATYVLMATAHTKDLGVLYKDYWEYRPPGFYLLIDLWAKIIGSQVLSFKILEALTRFLVGLQICLLARKIFSSFQALVVSSLAIVVFFSPAFGAWLYPEAYGIFFSLMGLLSLLYIQRLGLRFFLAAFFFSLSMQTKDIFGGAILAIIPTLFYFLTLWDYKSFIKGIVFALLGFLSPIIPLWLYLKNLGSLDAYFEVFKHKSGIYVGSFLTNIDFFLKRYYRFVWGSKQFITFFHDYTLIILIIWFVIALFLLFKNKTSLSLNTEDNSLALKIPNFRFSIDSRSVNLATVLFYSMGSYFGPSLMGLFSPHYVFSILIPTYFLWAIIALFIESSLRGLSKILKRNLIFLFVISFLLLPRDWIVAPYVAAIPKNVFQRAYRNLTLPEAPIDVERYINSKTKHEDCILSVYGWKSSETFLYSERKPCTRFFIPNMANADWQKEEYRLAIQENPPQAIVYSPGGADMDFLLFEREVINIPKILEACYQQDFRYTYGRWALKLYFPIYSDEELKTCIKKNAGGIK